MLSLAIDTSTEWGSLALGTELELLEFYEFRSAMRHSSALFPALATMGIHKRKIERIIVGLGPGSFSGIRVGLAAAYGLACVHRAQVVGICSGWSVARQYPRAEKLGIFADARRGEYYCTAFGSGAVGPDIYLLPREESATEAARYSMAVSAEPLENIQRRAYPRSIDFLAFPEGSPLFTYGERLEPIYLRDPVAPRSIQGKG